jgi:hypothetical protein
MSQAKPALASPFDDFAASQLQAKSKIFMGPLQTTLERLRALRDAEASMDVKTLAEALGSSTLDCLNPRGPLAAYANVRDVCTLNILVKSATLGPAAKNPPGSKETVAALEALDALRTSYDALSTALADENAVGAGREAAFEACRANVRVFAEALLACFPLDPSRAEETKASFPELFA